MANGDDTQPPAEGEGPGDSNHPVPADQPSTGSGTQGMSGLDEGWGEGEATFDEVFENVRAVSRGFQGNIMMAWLLLAGVTFGVETLEVMMYLVDWGLGIFGPIAWLIFGPLKIVAALAVVAVTGAQLSLYGPLREKVFHGIEPESWSDALGSVGTRGLKVTLALILIAIGIVVTCVLPGLVLAFFAVMAPYYLATDDLAIPDAFKRSYEMAKRYWQVVAVTIGALFGAGMIFGCLVGAGTGMAQFIPNPLGYIMYTYAAWFGGVLFQFLLFVVWGGVFVTVDANESGETVRV